MEQTKAKSYKLASCFSHLASRFLLLLLLLAVLPLASWAQQTVRGVVTDPSGDPLVGVSVIVKGSTTGVTTDLDGTYAIAARNGQTLVFSYVGMTTQEVKVSGSKLDIVLQENALNLDDVVVVGYGRQKKSSITGAVSAIKGDDLLVTPATNITQILGGRIAGISSVQTSG
ncbi:MAG: carboxypeptidase-like regulatory domain-containing protein, partial [Muribaculaceae bacterium]|nr:carboxypeptidase-like regulatory domain-containing protein [Muribaculaceae bacterium]